MIEGEFMRRSRIGQILVATTAGALLLASSVVAGAASTAGTYNAADAKLVPAAYKTGTLQVATDATYAPDESINSSGTMVGFDIDLINAIATTLGIKIHENNVTFDDIIAGIASKKYAIGNSSFTDNKPREKQVNFVDYFQAGEGVYAKVGTKVKFKGFSSFCGLKVAVETSTIEQTDAKTPPSHVLRARRLMSWAIKRKPKPTRRYFRAARTSVSSTLRSPVLSSPRRRVSLSCSVVPLTWRRTVSRRRRPRPVRASHRLSKRQ